MEKRGFIMIGSIFPVRQRLHRRSPSAAGSEVRIRQHTWKWAAGCALAVAALVWFVHRQLAARGFDWALVRAGIAGLRWNWLAFSLVPIFATYYGRALRWAVFLKPMKPHPGIWGLTATTVIGFTAITLFGRPGEFIRPYLIAKKENVPVTSQFAAWILERIFDLLMALLVFAFALTRVRSSELQVGENMAWVMAAGGKIVVASCLAILIAILSFRHLAHPLQERITAALRFLPEHHFERLARWMAAFVEGVASTRSDAALLLIFFYSAVEWLLITACYWCLARSFSATEAFTIVDILIFLGFVSFGAAIQIPGIGGGMQVVAVLVLTELFGMRLELATAFAFLTWFITFVAIVPIGLILALKEGLDWRATLRDVRRIGQEVSR
jgi:glycosyltransferase 2 family protein